MDEFEVFFKQAAEYHGHACAGIALGTKITLAALRYLGLAPGVRHKNLIVFVEVDRCMADAVQFISRCTLGHRTLKFVDYGKFGASFLNSETGRAVRATVRESFDSSGPIEQVAVKIGSLADAELVILEDIAIEIPPGDMPGHTHSRAICAKCGERVMDGREVVKEGRTLCRACAGNRYYRVR
jgi:formylmethanofuran dehydrogenase subunit E